MNAALHCAAPTLAAGFLLALLVASPSRAQVEFEPVNVLRGYADGVAGTIADANADGDLDYVVCEKRYSGESRFQTFLGTGDGRFEPGPVSPSPAHLAELVAADFDGDGAVDLAAYHLSLRSLEMYSGDGTGRFSLSSSVTAQGWGDTGQRIEAGDVDEDGVTDAVLSRRKAISVVLGGRGGWSLGSTWRMALIISERLADVDMDGHIDVVVLSRISATQQPSPSIVTVFRGDGRGGFVAWQVSEIDPEALYVGDFLVADFDGDAVFDVLALDGYWGASLLRGDPSGRFVPATSLRESVGTIYPHAADFNGNGFLDVIVVRGEGLGMSVLVNDGNGGFASQPIEDIAPGPIIEGVGDFDEDRHADIAVAGRGSPQTIASVFLNRSPGRCAAGTVNAGVGRITDVLFVNDSTGGRMRRIHLLTHEPLTVFVGAPPAAVVGSPFALFVWGRPPTGLTERRLPLGIGVTCFPTPLSRPDLPQPRVVWNNTGSPRLGVADLASEPAPSIALSLPLGVQRPAEFFVQGIVRDPGSAAEVPASVTNGITVEVR